MTTTATPCHTSYIAPDGEGVVLDNGRHAATIPHDVLTLLWNEARSSDTETATWPCDCHATRHPWNRDHLNGALDLAQFTGDISSCSFWDGHAECGRPDPDTLIPARCNIHRRH